MSSPRRVGGRETGPIGLGCMGMTWAYGADERDADEAIATIHRALDIGLHQRAARRPGDRGAP